MKILKLKWLSALIAGLLLSCAPPPSPALGSVDTAHQSDQLAAMQTLIEVHNTLEMERLHPIMAEDFIRIAPDVSTEGIEAYKVFLREFHSLFSEFHMTIERSAVEANGGFIKWRVRGTYIGQGAGAEGSEINVTGLGYYTFKDGKMTSEFIGFNPGWFREQLAQ